MQAQLIKVQCSTCGAIYSVLRPRNGFPSPCGLCRPVGKGTLRPIER
jgi:hypothetical protein